MPSRSSFGDKITRISVQPGVEILGVEISKKTHEIEYYITDFELNFTGSALEGKFRPEVLQRWNGKLASTTDFGEYLTRLNRHNFVRWSWAHNELKKLDKHIPRTLPKGFDLQPYLDQVRKEREEYDNRDHTIRDLMLKSPAFGIGNYYLYQNPPSETWKPSEKLKNIVKQDIPGTKQTWDQEIGHKKINTLTGIGAVVGGGTAPYIWKSPFYIKNLVKLRQQELMGQAIQDAFFSDIAIDTMAPAVVGLSGLPEIAGQPFWAALISFTSSLASSELSTQHRVGGSSKGLSEKITQEELDERIAEQTKRGRRLQHLSQGRLDLYRKQPNRPETTEEELARVEYLEAHTRATMGLGVSTAISSTKRGRMFTELRRDTQFRPVQQQLALYLELLQHELEQVKGVFKPEYLNEFEKLPKIGSRLVYRWQKYVINSVDIVPKGDKHHGYLVSATRPGMHGLETIVIPLGDLEYRRVGLYTRQSLGMRESVADVLRVLPIRMAGNMAISLGLSRGAKYVKQLVGYGSGAVLKKVVHKGLIDEDFSYYTGTITDAQYASAAATTQQLVFFGMANAANAWNWFVDCIDNPKPFPLAEVIDESLPRGMRSYRDLTTHELITNVPVTDALKKLAKASIEPFVAGYETVKSAASGLMKGMSGTVESIFYGVSFLAGAGILYKIVS